MAAVNWELFTNVVGSADPFHSSTDVVTKFEPKAVRVKPAPPTAEELGEILDSVGTGLGTTLTISGVEGDVRGLLRVIESEPSEVKFAGGKVKSNCVSFPP